MLSIRNIIWLVIIITAILYFAPTETIKNIPGAESLKLLDLQIWVKVNITQLIHMVREALQTFMGAFFDDMFNQAQQSVQERIGNQ